MAYINHFVRNKAGFVDKREANLKRLITFHKQDAITNCWVMNEQMWRY